jgi:ATP-dependent helicase/nuclease subunit B
VSEFATESLAEATSLTTLRRWRHGDDFFGARRLRARRLIKAIKILTKTRLADSCTLFLDEAVQTPYPYNRKLLMQTILGPFHPHLETALIKEIRKSKAADPLGPLLVLLPSDLLRRRLKLLLTREPDRAFVNLWLMPFHQLTFRLLSENYGLRLPVLRDDLFLEEVLRHAIRTGKPGTEAFAGIDEKAGGCAALWQTLRDLRDGMVDPAIALEAYNEGHFSPQTNARVVNLLTLFQTLFRVCEERGIQGYSEWERYATEQVPSSAFLKQFSRILIYGFYDLTQVQLDLFSAVAENYSTTLFFPLFHAAPSHQAWSFAERFFQRYIQGRAVQNSAVVNLLDDPEYRPLGPAARLFDLASDRPVLQRPGPWVCKIFNTFGSHDEIATVAKEILDLVTREEMAFEEIGIVARALDPYRSIIKELFHQHSIPLARSLEEPLAQFPLTKSVILLLNLPAKDFLRAHVIDLLSSPYFRLFLCDTDRAPPRPDLWDLATRELGICKGTHEWSRLKKFLNRDLVVSRMTRGDEPGLITIAAAQIRRLVHVFNTLHSDLAALPEKAQWSDYASAWQELLRKYLKLSIDHESELPTSDERLSAEIFAILDRVAGLDALGADVSLKYFSHTFQHWLERSHITFSPDDTKGVAVLSATAARGLSFRVLFIVGLNEGQFPRTIREDAFLRDRERQILERDLGFKVNPKLAGFDEEKLIFSLLAGAARERLYCFFQRADESGRALAPSWYLTELKRAVGCGNGAQVSESTIPRSLADKATVHPFMRQDLLLPEELAVRLALEGRNATSLLARFGLAATLYRQGRRMVERLDLSSSRLDSFDGVIKPLSEFWDAFSHRGLSPTALETYVRCPFQFFAQHVLGLERLERPEESISPKPAEFGELGHLILKIFYQQLIDQDNFTANRSGADWESVLAAATDRACAEYEATNPVGYPLAWESVQENLEQILHQVVAQDLNELSSSGWLPTALEVDVRAQLDTNWSEPLGGLTIRGRMDRIDCDPERNRLRVVDYKFKLGGTATVLDRDLSRAALRGERLQPFFYFLLAKRLAARKKLRLVDPDIEANFYYIAPKWTKGPLVRANFGAEGLSEELGEAIKATVAFIVNGIRQGRFFICPGNHCRYCDVSEICRKNHPPSLWRAENDPITRPHQELHQKDPKKQ